MPFWPPFRPPSSPMTHRKPSAPTPKTAKLCWTPFPRRLLDDLLAHREEIDAIITAHLKGWTLARLPRVSLTAMRIALAEMLYGEEKKPGVAINEAVELVKKYGADNDHQFVNGLLGSVAREQEADPAAENAPC